MNAFLPIRGRRSLRRRPASFVRWCNAYVNRKTGDVMVARCFNHDGMSAEIPGGTVRLAAPGTAEVGAAVAAALDACVYEETFNYRHTKRSDWPAFQVSGERTMRAFEEKWVRMQIRGANEENETWELIGPEIGSHGLRLVAVAVPTMDHPNLGRALTYLAEAIETTKELF
jgi:hypothetical protein